MKIILLILGIVQISLGQELPPDHAANILKLKTALGKLQGTGLSESAYNFLLNTPNGDQIINSLLSSLSSELSPIIGSPGPNNLLGALIGDSLQQIGTMETILNGLGYEDVDMYAYIFTEFYNELVYTLQEAAQNIDPSIPATRGHKFALPTPTRRASPEIIAAFSNALTNAQNNANNLQASLSTITSQPGSENLLSLFLAKIFNLLGGTIGAIAQQSGLGSQVIDGFNQNMLEVVEVLGVLDIYGVSEEDLFELVLMKFFSEILESFGELLLHAQELPDVPPADIPNPPADTPNPPADTPNPPADTSDAQPAPPANNPEQPSKVQQITYLLTKSQQDSNELKAIATSLNLQSIDFQGDVFGPILAPLLGSLTTQGENLLAQQPPEIQARFNTAIENIIYDINGLKQIIESEDVDWDAVILGFIPEILERFVAHLGNLALSRV